MKFFLPIVLFAIAGVSAQDKNCRANYIVDRCLSTETPKVAACDSTDYGCQCAAYQAVATCYNNCPSDPRADGANSQVTVYCRNASLYSTTAKMPTLTATSSLSQATDDSTTTTSSTGMSPSSTDTFTNEEPDNNGGPGEFVINTGGVLMAVAAVVAAVL